MRPRRDKAIWGTVWAEWIWAMLTGGPYFGPVGMPYRFSREREDTMAELVTEWLRNNRPRYVSIVEIGISAGGSLLLWDDLLQLIPHWIIGVDPGPHWRLMRNLRGAFQPNSIEIIRKYSGEYLRDLKSQTRDINYIDGDHREQYAFEDILESWRILRPGGLLLIDDNDDLSPGVRAAIVRSGLPIQSKDGLAYVSKATLY